jgi:ferredoxin-nitrate reductase
MGVNQSSVGTAKVRAIINLHLMTAQIGKPELGRFPYRSAERYGGREAGGLSHILPGYRLVKIPNTALKSSSFGDSSQDRSRLIRVELLGR